jgi:hypothetical protein
MGKKKSKFSKQFQQKIKAKKAGNINIGASRNQFAQKVKKHAAEYGHEVMFDTSNPQKMSDIIFHYAEPLLEEARTDEDEEKAIVLAITLWNMTIAQEDERQKMIDSLAFKGKDSAMFSKTLAYFLERKQELYPDVNRMILDYDCVQTPDGLYLNVASTVT